MIHTFKIFKPTSSPSIYSSRKRPHPTSFEALLKRFSIEGYFVHSFLFKHMNIDSYVEGWIRLIFALKMIWKG